MKYTLLVTQKCNLSCDYCYITKRNLTMDLITAKKFIDFIFKHTPHSEIIRLGFFGGEPLLEFGLIKEITNLIENHPKYSEYKVELDLVSNGTIFTEEIAEFLMEHSIGFGISCDGNKITQDRFRRFRNGEGSSTAVEENIKKAVKLLPYVMVNAVYTPSTFRELPQTVKYLYDLGIRKIYMNLDYSAPWSIEDAKGLAGVYDKITSLYLDFYEAEDPALISLIDNKMAVILNEGYRMEDRCHMGKKEFAFSPEGNIFPCERLVGDGTKNSHCIGDIENGIDYTKLICSPHQKESSNSECKECSLKDYCMNWCGCSNYLASGYYNRVTPFLCKSEKSAISAAFNAFELLEKKYGALTISKLLSAGKSCQREERVV